MNDTKKFEAWKKAHAFAKAIYEQNQEPPQELVRLLKEKVVSLTSNLTQDNERFSPIKGTSFEVAYDQACDIEYYLLLLKDLQYIQDKNYNVLNQSIVEIKELIVPLIQREFPHHL